jgi:hypothetical protein
MSDQTPRTPEQTEQDQTIWEYGRTPSLLEHSPDDMSDSRKSMIRYALDQHPIRDIRTYSGYKGDLLIEITTSKADLLPLLKTYADKLGMRTAVKENRNVGIYELYCIAPDEDIYQIKGD